MRRCFIGQLGGWTSTEQSSGSPAGAGGPGEVPGGAAGAGGSGRASGGQAGAEIIRSQGAAAGPDSPPELVAVPWLILTPHRNLPLIRHGESGTVDSAFPTVPVPGPMQALACPD